MNIPTNLKHRPVVALEDYEDIDGKYQNSTDAVGLSVGFAQWFSGELSAKIWRYSKDSEKWSRQSEEVPLHRVLDLAILITECFANLKNVDSNSNEIVKFPSLQGCQKKITMCKWDGRPIPKNRVDGFVSLLKDEEKKYLNERFQALADILKSLGY